MQVVSFDFWSWLFTIFTFLFTCNQSTPVSDGGIQLNMPKQEAADAAKAKEYATLRTKLTLILLEDDKVYAYEGVSPDRGVFCNKSALRGVITGAKRRLPSPEFTVLIKPTAKTSYAFTVDVLDEMTINKISRYAITELTPEETAKLQVEDRASN